MQFNIYCVQNYRTWKIRLVHFLKEHRGYAFLHGHDVLHVSYAEDRSYVFDDDEVVRFLEAKVKESPAYSDLLCLRRQLLDGADFPKPLRKRHA